MRVDLSERVDLVSYGIRSWRKRWSGEGAEDSYRLRIGGSAG